MIGETIQGYEIQSQIGAGGFGVVYRAYDTSVNRDVAIKVILPQFADNSEFRQRFDSEAQLVAKLESPHILPLYSYWQDEQGAFLVMRYIRSGSLRTIMEKRKALSLSETIRIVSDIAEALTVSHENNVVHRDLKPENILIDERDNAYLTDFGIAKQTTSTENITGASDIVGTWAYLSPEQIENADVSPQTDVYAFGILIYEMLVGEHPFQGESAMSMAIKHVHEPLPYVRDMRPDLPPQLDEIIQKATAKDPADRYLSTIDLLIELKKIGTTSISSIQPRIRSTPRKKPSSPEQRNRLAMLQNVRSFWIEGVLENNMHEAMMIDLGLKPESGAVENPWDTLIRTPSGEETLSDERIINVFERLNGKLLILGDPGSGKTMTLLTLARDLLDRAVSDDHHPIPVVFNLASWSENQSSITEWLVDELHNKYQVPHKLATQWIEDEALIPLLDGLDEVELEVRESCVQAINDYRSEHGFSDVVVCSRINDYEALTGKLKLNGAVVIQPLDDTQIVHYLEALGEDVAIVHKLITRDEQLHELSKSPLMLSVLVLAYRGMSTDDIPRFDDIEIQRQQLFNIYIKRMFEHRGEETTYTHNETQNYLSWLAKKMQEQTQSVFQIEELQPTIVPEEQRTAYYRRVRVLNVFATISTFSIEALLIALATNLSIIVTVSGLGIAFGAWIAWVYSGNEWKHFRNLVLAGAIFGITISIVISLKSSFEVALLYGALSIVGTTVWIRLYTQFYYSSHGDKDTIPLIETVQFSWKNIQPIHWLLIIALNIFQMPVIVGMLVIGLDLSSTNFVLGWLTLALASSMALIFISGLGFGNISTRYSPNQGVRTTFRMVSLISIGMAVSTVIAFVVLALIMDIAIWRGIALGVGFGMGFIGYAIWASLGGIGIYRHWMLRQTLTRQGYLPANLAHFLDYASTLILMRKVGGGYIFMHRYLLEYFANLEPAENEVSA